jgi:hypothetical protein
MGGKPRIPTSLFMNSSTLGAPGLDFETGETTNLNQLHLKQTTPKDKGTSNRLRPLKPFFLSY